MADLTLPATAATAPQQPEKRLLQTPLRNSLATAMGATPATALQHLCNKVQQSRNSPKIDLRNSATAPYRGGETVAPHASRPRARNPEHPAKQPNRPAFGSRAGSGCSGLTSLAETQT
jgi:hypothetical protein